MKNIEEFTLKLGDTFSGSPISSKGYRHTNGEGPTVYIQGGAHGGEITYPIFQMLDSFLKENDSWKGTITLVPVANPISWMQRLYFYTAGKFNMYDGKDWNWFFPGKENGTTAQRYAHMLFQEANKHELIIDLHTSRNSKPFIIVGKKELLHYGLTSGILPTFFSPTEEQKDARLKIIPLSDAADMANKEGITIECGAHDNMDMKVFKQCFEAVKNILITKGVIEGEKPTQPKEAFVYNGYHTYTAPISGFVEYLHDIEAEVKEGETLYKISSTTSLSEVIEVKAKADCIISKYQPTHIALVGDQVAMTIPKDNIEK